MENYFESTLGDILRWELYEQLNDLASEDPDEESHAAHHPAKAVYSFQRDYVSLYGTHPKMESRIFSSCGACEQVFNPHVVGNHKNHCSGKGRSQLQQLRKKVKNKKKSQGATVPFPPLFKVSKESPGPPVLSKFSDIAPPQVPRLTPDVLVLPESIATKMPEPLPSTSIVSPPTPPPPPLPPSPVLPPHEESLPPRVSSSRHKKKKSSKGKDSETESETQKGPSTRSINCSNHKVSPRNIGRSKKATKDKESHEENLVEMNASCSPKEFMFSIIQPEPITDNHVPESVEQVSDFVSTPKFVAGLSLPEITANELHDQVESDDPSNLLESGYCPVETSLSTKSLPVLYLNPISPIYVVTPVQKQFIQKENTVFVEATSSRVHSPPLNSYFLSMPEPTSTIKLYKSHPKPATLPLYGSRKVGGAILGSNQRLEYQRNDIQMAITTKRSMSSSNCKATPYNVPTHRSILLKMKGLNNKVNCKRSSTEKISVSDSKSIKLPADVNGFFLHTEMSDVAETLQTNHCIQENINLLNIK